MYRSRKDKMLFGVLAGLSKWIGFENPGLLRVLFVITLFITSGLPILIYFLIAVFIPYDHADDVEIKKE